MSRETEELVREVLAKRNYTKALLSNVLEVEWEDIAAWLNGTKEPSKYDQERLMALLHE